MSNNTDESCNTGETSKTGKTGTPTKVSYKTIFILVIVALLIAWWNYAANCTPVDALYNSNFMPTNSFKKLLFPVVKLYYVILCIFFFLFPMYILLQASILLKNKIT